MESLNNMQGILIYPVVTNKFSAAFKYLGFNLRIQTINLNQDWKQIEEDLLGVVT